MNTCMRGLCARAACTRMGGMWSWFLGGLAVAAAHNAAFREGGCIPLACLQCCLLTAHPVVRPGRVSCIAVGEHSVQQPVSRLCPGSSPDRQLLGSSPQ